MKQIPAVSIIMNCLNCAQTLPQTLQSAREQTFDDFEIIFFDNGSTDGSVKIAGSFDSRLRCFRNPQTVPLGRARNLAIRESRAPLIAFLDCDDLWRPEKLAAQTALFAANPNLGLAATDTEIFNEKRVLGRVFAQSAPARGHVFEELMSRQWISMSSSMIRRAALDEVAESPGVWFDESLNVCEEADLFYRIAHGWEADYVDAPLTGWRVHGSNTTFRKFGQFAEETQKILQKHRRLYPGYDLKYPRLVALLNDRINFQKAVALWRESRGREARARLAQISAKTARHRLFWAVSHLPGSFFDAAAGLYFALPKFLRG